MIKVYKSPVTKQRFKWLVFSPPYEPEERERREAAVREGAGGFWTAVPKLFRGSGGLQERELL